MKRLPSLILALVVSVTAIVPASADTYIDTIGQLGQSGTEHYIFWKTYQYAFFQEDGYLKKGIRYSADPLIWTYTDWAFDQWNNTRPQAIEEMVESDGNPSNTDLALYYSSCPGYPLIPVCYGISSWTSVLYPHNVRMWNKSQIYIKYGVAGYQWWTHSLKGAIAQGIGNALGLATQNNWTCAPGYYGVMETIYRSNGYWEVCDTFAPSATDSMNWTAWHWNDRYYWYSWNVDGGGLITYLYTDGLYNDGYLRASWQKSTVSSTGPWTEFTVTTDIIDNGTFQAVQTRYLPIQHIPHQGGVNHVWIRTCVRPVYNWIGSMGAETCAPSLRYDW